MNPQVRGDQAKRAVAAPAQPKFIDSRRMWSIGFRTVHLMAAGLLLGGHFFRAPAHALLPWLYLAIATGIGMIAFEAWPRLDFLVEGWWLLLLVKLGLLCTIPFAWNHRVPILFAIMTLAGVGSHLPKRMRHYRVFAKQ